jgi:hypothetical protein
MSDVQNTGTSNDTKAIITVLLLVFLYPIGLLVMWFWTKWKLWVKLLVSAPVLLFIVIMILGILAAGVNPNAQILKADCVRSCAQKNTQSYCTTFCANPNNYLQSSSPSPTQ